MLDIVQLPAEGGSDSPLGVNAPLLPFENDLNEKMESLMLTKWPELPQLHSKRITLGSKCRRRTIVLAKSIPWVPDSPVIPISSHYYGELTE